MAWQTDIRNDKSPSIAAGGYVAITGRAILGIRSAVVEDDLRGP